MGYSVKIEIQTPDTGKDVSDGQRKDLSDGQRKDVSDGQSEVKGGIAVADKHKENASLKQVLNSDTAGDRPKETQILTNVRRELEEEISKKIDSELIGHIGRAMSKEMSETIGEDLKKELSNELDKELNTGLMNALKINSQENVPTYAENMKHDDHFQGKPVHHVFYLKTHKTGSTTMHGILSEYCRSHNLTPLLPKGNHFGLYQPFDPVQLDLAQPDAKYDMAFNHMLFRPSILEHLPEDTFR